MCERLAGEDRFREVFQPACYFVVLAVRRERVIEAMTWERAINAG